MAEPFRVLFVCTGNVCRSPMAEAMLRHVLTVTRQHRALVATAQASVIRRAFTIREFARLAAFLAVMAHPH